MIEIIERYNKINNEAKELSVKKVTLVAISKSFSLNFIKPLIDFGHLHYGENKIQETFVKWSEIISKKINLQLHMVGKLQSNKVSEAINLFSYIHSLDNEKLAFRLSEKEKEYGKRLKYFIQINIADENQKSGISKMQASDFIHFCINELKLNVVGLMCIPPFNIDPSKYFNHLKQIADQEKLSELSMGMSNDYKIAIQSGSTFIRIGSAIFGKRD
jgi:hypothetical protein